MSLDQISKGREDKQRCSSGGREIDALRIRVEGGSNWEGKKETERREKRGRFERQKEKAVLIFTDSQRFLNILLLPAV